MFFGWRKRKKLEEETKKQEQQRILEEAKIEAYAYSANLETFYKICDMVRSLPKKRQIVVVQRKNSFQDDSRRNWWYMKAAREMRHQNRVNGAKWISFCNYSLYAFYMPVKLDYDFRQALADFSKGGYLIQRIRYYHFNY